MFSPSVLTLILAQPACDAPLRRTLVERFAFESDEWPLLDRMRLPDGIPATRDPVLLALRRLVRRDFGGLRESHRLAAESAETRPFGLLHLIFEEVALLAYLDAEPPPAERDGALRIFFEILASGCQEGPQGWDLLDLRARGVAVAVERLSGLPAPFSLTLGEDGHNLGAVKASAG